MNAKLMASALLVIGAVLAMPLAAQTIVAQPTPTPVPIFADPYSYHASTLEEGAARGIASIIASSGVGNYYHSQAARNYQEAVSRYLDNRLKAQQTYFEMRKYNREYRAAERGPRPTTEQMARFARDRAPDRLQASELNPITGQIYWPDVLEDDAFRDHRERLDDLFALRARYRGEIGPDQYLELRRTVKSMDQELKARITEYPPTDYVKAKNIIESLAYEASLTTGPSVADSRPTPVMSLVSTD
jgi:hypothetical protein